VKFPSEETARSIEGRALGKDQNFWSRNDLIYLGDLSWTGQSNPEGYEYITTPMRSGEYFEYIYGMIMISKGANINELVCKIKGPMDNSKTFMMNIGNQWIEGPLKAWVETMEKDQQLKTKHRYEALISWIYTQV
jgi:hypothetical protein